MNAPEIWIALLRIVVGAWFLKAVWTKLVLEFTWGVVPYIGVSERFLAFQPKRVAEFASGNPIGWYKDFLEAIVLPHANLFATLQSYAEVIVGIGLVAGFCIGITALLGLFLTLNYGLATQWMSFGQQGFHLLLICSMIIFLGARAGRVWGIDGLMLRYASVIREKRWRAATLALIGLTLLAFTGTSLAAE